MIQFGEVYGWQLVNFIFNVHIVIYILTCKNNGIELVFTSIKMRLMTHEYVNISKVSLVKTKLMQGLFQLLFNYLYINFIESIRC
jgi:hypothetical protein